MGFLEDVVEGTAGAPLIWWIVALIVLVGLLVLGLRLLGLFPE